MRISDWSSDVCSSDLLIDHIIGSAVRQRFTILRVAACRRSVGQGVAAVGLAVLAPAFAAGRKFFDEIRNAALGHHLSVEERPTLLHMDDIYGKARHPPDVHFLVSPGTFEQYEFSPRTLNPGHPSST